MSSKYNKLSGKHVLVLGGSAGIGLGVAEAALAGGADVVISSSSQARVDAAVASLKQQFPDRAIRGVATDLSRTETLEADLEALFVASGPTDHVVLTAADGLTLVPLNSLTAETALSAARMRMLLPLLLAKVAQRHLAPSRFSSLTLTTGAVTERPVAGWSLVAYLAGGIQTLTKALAVEMAPVRVNAVRPGIVDTGLWDHTMGADQRATMIKSFAGRMLTASAGHVEDVAESYIWLMKDANVTGTVAATDGGALLV